MTGLYCAIDAVETTGLPQQLQWQNGEQVQGFSLQLFFCELIIDTEFDAELAKSLHVSNDNVMMYIPSIKYQCFILQKYLLIYVITQRGLIIMIICVFKWVLNCGNY